jgi:hypothetical protein
MYASGAEKYDRKDLTDVSSSPQNWLLVHSDSMFHAEQWFRIDALL